MAHDASNHTATKHPGSRTLAFVPGGKPGQKRKGGVVSVGKGSFALFTKEFRKLHAS